MNWKQVANTWERVKESAGSAWDQAAGRIGSAIEANKEREADVRRRAQALPEYRPPRGCEIRPAGPPSALVALAGAGLGAGLMYMFDPQRGRRRRAMVRDRIVSALHDLDDAMGVLSRDIGNRARGVWAVARSMPTRMIGDSAPDDVLIARVRAKLGRCVSHPRAIEVDASEGRVSLRGPILAHELDRLLRVVARVPGVRRVDDDLDVYESSEAVPLLQGGRPRGGERFALTRTNWSPTARLLVGSAGGVLALAGAERGGPSGFALGGVGAAMLARAATNIPMRDWAGVMDRTTEHHPSARCRTPAAEMEMIENAARI